MLVVLAVTQLLVVFDATIIDVALPAIATDLEVTSGDADPQWVVTGYTLAFGGSSSSAASSPTGSGAGRSWWPGPHCLRSLGLAVLTAVTTARTTALFPGFEDARRQLAAKPGADLADPAAATAAAQEPAGA